MKYIYPCIIIPESVGYSVIFPDIKGATSGETLIEALEMAEDFAEFTVQTAPLDNEEIPVPTPPEKVEVPQGAFMTLIKVDTDAYRQSL